MRVTLALSFVLLSGCTWIFGRVDRTELASVVCPAAPVAVGYQSGSGTAADPYVICSVQQWKNLAANTNDWSRSLKLGAALDFSGYSISDFPFVGTSSIPFTGSFDGGGFKISNISLSSGSGQVLGLFPYTNNAITLQNIVLENVTLSTTGAFGALIGSHGTGGLLTVNNVTFSSFTLTSGAGASGYAGGLVGRSQSSVSMSNISGTTMTLVSPAMGGNAYGGILASCEASSCVFDNIRLTDLSMPASPSQYRAGVVGVVFYGASFSNITITNISISASGGSYIAGIIGGSGAAFSTNSNVSFSSIVVTGINIFGANPTGGLIGGSNAGANSHLTISRASVSGLVGSGGSVGGLAGNWGNGDVTVDRAFFSGTISGFGSPSGGLWGSINLASRTLSLTDSYARATVTTSGGGSASGFGNASGASSTATLTNSYAAGALTSAGTKGCTLLTAASVTTLTINDVYYDLTLCVDGETSSGNHANIFGVATGAMQPAAPFTNWSPTTWLFTSGQYPSLR